MSKVDTKVSAPDGNPSKVKFNFPSKAKFDSLKLLDGRARWKLQDQIL